MTHTDYPDPDIFAAARKALDADPEVPQSVHVHVEHGTVTLTGTVQWPREKAKAESIVRRVAGARHIANDITVTRVVRPEGFEAPDTR